MTHRHRTLHVMILEACPAKWNHQLRLPDSREREPAGFQVTKCWLELGSDMSLLFFKYVLTFGKSGAQVW